jgi:hypothetical protein
MPTQLAMTDLIAMAAIVMGFGVTVVMFRLQREAEIEKDRLRQQAEMEKDSEPTWIAYSDWLILFSIFVSLLFVFFPLFLLPYQLAISIAHAGCFAAIVLQAGYIPSILAHYRLLLGKNRKGPRENPEPKERLFVWLSIAIAILGGVLSSYRR